MSQNNETMFNNDEEEIIILPKVKKSRKPKKVLEPKVLEPIVEPKVEPIVEMVVESMITSIIDTMVEAEVDAYVEPIVNANVNVNHEPIVNVNVVRDNTLTEEQEIELAERQLAERKKQLLLKKQMTDVNFQRNFIDYSKTVLIKEMETYKSDKLNIQERINEYQRLINELIEENDDLDEAIAIIVNKVDVLNEMTNDDDVDFEETHILYDELSDYKLYLETNIENELKPMATGVKPKATGVKPKANKTKTVNTNNKKTPTKIDRTEQYILVPNGTQFYFSSNGNRGIYTKISNDIVSYNINGTIGQYQVVKNGKVALNGLTSLFYKLSGVAPTSVNAWITLKTVDGNRTMSDYVASL